MSELFVQGLILSAFGIGLTFSGLGLLILVILLLRSVFVTKKPATDTSTEPDSPLKATSLSRDTQHEEVVAAIATALTHLRTIHVTKGRLGASLEKGPGRWWTRGVAQNHRPHMRH
jgi:sodium pump decarboxylase gamma subunit